MNLAEPHLADPQLAKIETSPLYSLDLAPVPADRRKWGMLSFAALWISMSACVPICSRPASSPTA